MALSSDGEEIRDVVVSVAFWQPDPDCAVASSLDDDVITACDDVMDGRKFNVLKRRLPA